MSHRLITFSGICSGSGKSTLSSALSAELIRRGIANRLLTEDQLLETEWFGRFDRQLGHADPNAIETLLQGARALEADYSAAKVIVITDALLPGFMWLLGRYPLDRVARFRDELAEVLLPLHPLHVYLGGDPTTLFGRAVSERGTAFRERSIAAVKRWRIPHCPDGPLQSGADVMRFYAWLDGRVKGLAVGSHVRTVLLDATLSITDLLRLLEKHVDSEI